MSSINSTSSSSRTIAKAEQTFTDESSSSSFFGVAGRALNGFTNLFTTPPERNASLSDRDVIEITDQQDSNHALREFSEKICTLWVQHKNLTSLPVEITWYKGLYKLKLNNNYLTSLPPAIGDLKNLMWLDLSVNQLTSLPREIGGLKELRSLKLLGSDLVSLPKEIGSLKELTFLDLQHNLLTSLPEEIGKLSNLTDLNLGNNRFTYYPEGINSLKALEELNISSINIRKLPAGIGNLRKLRKLLIDNPYNRCKLRSLPKEIGDLIQLEELTLRIPTLKKLPKEMENLVNLKELDLFMRSIETSKALFNSLPPNFKSSFAVHKPGLYMRITEESKSQADQKDNRKEVKMVTRRSGRKRTKLY